MTKDETTNDPNPQNSPSSSNTTRILFLILGAGILGINYKIYDNKKNPISQIHAKSKLQAMIDLLIEKEIAQVPKKMTKAQMRMSPYHFSTSPEAFSRDNVQFHTTVDANRIYEVTRVMFWCHEIHQKQKKGEPILMVVESVSFLKKNGPSFSDKIARFIDPASYNPYKEHESESGNNSIISPHMIRVVLAVSNPDDPVKENYALLYDQRKAFKSILDPEKMFSGDNDGVGELDEDAEFYRQMEKIQGDLPRGAFEK